MLHLARKFNSFLTSSRKQPQLAEATTTAALPRKPSGDSRNICHWSSAEVGILIEWELERKVAMVNLDGNQRRHETRILGVDLTTNQLLLDTLFPAVPASQMDHEQPFWLILKLSNADYHVCVQPRQILQDRCLLADIITTRYLERTSVSFASDSSPRVALRLNSGRQFRARIKSLSTEGARLIVDSHTGRELSQMATPMACTLQFNERFSLNSEAWPLIVSATRPEKMAHVDVRFDYMSRYNQLQLHSFLATASASADTTEGNVAA